MGVPRYHYRGNTLATRLRVAPDGFLSRFWTVWGFGVVRARIVGLGLCLAPEGGVSSQFLVFS